MGRFLYVTPENKIRQEFGRGNGYGRDRGWKGRVTLILLKLNTKPTMQWTKRGGDYEDARIRKG